LADDLKHGHSAYADGYSECGNRREQHRGWLDDGVRSGRRVHVRQNQHGAKRNERREARKSNSYIVALEADEQSQTNAERQASREESEDDRYHHVRPRQPVLRYAKNVGPANRLRHEQTT